MVGRASRFFITMDTETGGSYKVYHEHVQTTISNLGAVRDCVMIDVPDSQSVNVGKAFIVPAKGLGPNNQTKQKILLQIEQQGILKSYEIPKKIVFLDSIPRTSVGKINFKSLTHM